MNVYVKLMNIYMKTKLRQQISYAMHLKASSPPSRKNTTPVRLELTFVLPSDGPVGFQINTSVYRCVQWWHVCVVDVSAETYIDLSVYGHCVTTNLDLKAGYTPPYIR